MRSGHWARVAAGAIALVAVALLVGIACGSSSSSRRGEGPRGSRGSTDAHERCDNDDARVAQVDVNGDGRPDIRRVMDEDSGRERCREVDLNFDGRIDVVRVFDDQGRVLREDLDFDFDGRIDEIAFYRAGNIVRKELDTNFDNAIDMWIYCANGVPTRAERDRTSDGRPDTWETYQSGRLMRIRYDTDLDGRADRTENDPEAEDEHRVILSCTGPATPLVPGVAADAGPRREAPDAGTGGAGGEIIEAPDGGIDFGEGE